MFLLRKSEPRRQNQFHADIARKSEERRRRSQELLSPDFLETSEEWNAANMAAHERRFPFGDNLTTFVFFVASDLSATQRERLTSSLSIQEIDVTAYTFKKVKVAFGIFLFAGRLNLVEILQFVQNIHN